MQLTEIKNVKFIGSNGRLSLLDVIYPANVAGLPLIIFAHGFKGFKDWGHFPILSRRMAEAGFAVVSFNFSHNGGTIDDPIDFPDLEAFSENNYLKEQNDLDEIIQWAQKDQSLPMGVWDNSEIYLIGHSRGGSMAILKAANNPAVKKVVSWAAVSDLESRLPNQDELDEWKQKGIRYIKNSRTNQDMPMKYQFVECLLENRDKLKLEKAVKSLAIPQLIIHGEADESVPFEAAKDLKKWNPSATLKSIESTGHTFGGKHPWTDEELPQASEKLIKLTIDFLKS